uniref:Uncharacterized protein n=1 Tax=Siphoviridae sp. ctCCX1 TaxID=2823567 RepID=A0A8S5LDJ4_9CAUD|nr:MAG TPA: hypothetical protein [Siphoviridae sp. ctCCX1]
MHIYFVPHSSTYLLNNKYMILFIADLLKWKKFAFKNLSFIMILFYTLIYFNFDLSILIIRIISITCVT